MHTRMKQQGWSELIVEIAHLSEKRGLSFFFFSFFRLEERKKRKEKG